MKSCLSTWVSALLAAMIALVVSSPALASAKITLKPYYDVESAEVTKYVLGVPVYERIAENVAIIYWMGGGIMKDADENWAKIDTAIEFYSGPWAVGFGGNLEHTLATQDAVETLYGTLSLTLWE